MKKSEETVECEIMLGIALTSARRNQQAVEILKRASAYFELKHHQYMSNPTSSFFILFLFSSIFTYKNEIICSPTKTFSIPTSVVDMERSGSPKSNSESE